MDLRHVVFRSRDFVIAFALSVPLGALVAASVGAFSTLASPLFGAVTFFAAIFGIVLGPLAVVGALIGYAIARTLGVGSRWLFSVLVASGSGIAMVLVMVLVAATEASTLVSETIDGHPSNPWLDALPVFPVLFVAGFVPAWVSFFVYVTHKVRHANPAGAASREPAPAPQS